MTTRRPAPTTEQLLMIVNAADRRPLTHEEQAVLRVGIQRLDAARRSAGGTQAALRNARAQLAQRQTESKGSAA